MLCSTKIPGIKINLVLGAVPDEVSWYQSYRRSSTMKNDPFRTGKIARRDVETLVIIHKYSIVVLYIVVLIVLMF